MRICLVYDCLFPLTVGGAERWYRNVAERLAGAGHEVTYVTLRQWDRGEPPRIDGVRVVAVGPGYVETPLVRAAVDRGAIAAEDILPRIPAGRMAAPEEIASVIAFLASPDAAYITGAVIPVDGGLGMGH